MTMRTSAVTLMLAAALTIGAAPAAAGPPWISVEYPTNPHHPTTRNAAFLVRIYHHSTSIQAKVTGRAEGMVDGRRTSRPLTVEPTALPGVYAVSGLPDGRGDWVAIVTMADGSAIASAVVTLGPGGAVSSATVPSDRTADGWSVPRAVTDADIALGLRQAAALSAATRNLGDQPASDSPAGAALPALMLLPVALVAAGWKSRRRQTTD
jgi:hypothetical protein